MPIWHTKTAIKERTNECQQLGDLIENRLQLFIVADYVYIYNEIEGAAAAEGQASSKFVFLVYAVNMVRQAIAAAVCPGLAIKVAAASTEFSSPSPPLFICSFSWSL